MAFSPLVERWRGLVGEVAPDLPVGLVLAIVSVESAGITGREGPTNDWGLMQTLPAHLPTYNREHPGARISLADLQGTGREDGRKQLRLGCWYLRRCLRAVHRWFPLRWPWVPGVSPEVLGQDQALFSDLCYSGGITGAAELRAGALRAGFPDTIEGLEAYRPNWGGRRPRRRYQHARKVVGLWLADTGPGVAAELPAVSTTAPPLPAGEPGRAGGVALGLLLLAGLVWGSSRLLPSPFPTLGR